MKKKLIAIASALVCALMSPIHAESQGTDPEI